MDGDSPHAALVDAAGETARIQDGKEVGGATAEGMPTRGCNDDSTILGKGGNE
jgi:hypothetical protein